ncbi:MAG TPA: hypothetical protein VE134_00390, partial [Methanomicrobiales archaeon]|nr:hypothetical protein [Methanomicrobiales archaeon]
MSTLYKLEPIDAWLTPLMISVITLGAIQLLYSLLIGPNIATRYPAFAAAILQYMVPITVGMFA